MTPRFPDRPEILAQADGTLSLQAWARVLEDARSGDSASRLALDRALRESSRPEFLTSLDATDRERWVALVLETLRVVDHRIGDLLASRAEEMGDHPLFAELDAPEAGAWTYRATWRRAREYAAALIAAQTPGRRGRVAIWAHNSVDAAITDLACMAHDVLVVPLGTHLEIDEVQWILDRLDIDTVVVDTDDRAQRMCRLRDRARPGLRVISLNSDSESAAVPLLGELASRLAPSQVDSILDSRPRIGMDDVATVMFTSGSTGRPKGVAFTPMNLISKRYCRAAAVPDLGRDEVFLCYLPLFHTFGRYLEMLGAVFWRGTYVFAGNPSFETLRSGLAIVRPTVLISIPLRWQQLRGAVIGDADLDEASEHERFVDVTGGRLRWGLSAAGHLEPRVFRFFHRHGVALCSGFGMTEATGGITMSPPGDYVDETVGKPLPGIEVSLDENDEMLIRGPYVARYLAESGGDLECEELEELEGSRWLRTGDVFRELGDGHLQIVDRVKDIYKNSRGQTIAPRRAEDQFHGAPGVRRVYLVGDHRPFNALLIVADESDPVIRDAPDDYARHEYFGQIIAAANERLAPFERIVNYAVLDRDFDAARGELTPKGSLRRKVIEENFASVIAELYDRPSVRLNRGDLVVDLPHWLVRDLGGLARDFAVDGDHVVDRRRDVTLTVVRNPQRGTVRVGDLEYNLNGDVVDLGRLCRQPALWIGNTALLRFCHCRDGWDVDPAPFGHRVWLPAHWRPDEDFTPTDSRVEGDRQLVHADRLVQVLLHATPERALAVIEELATLVQRADRRLGRAIRHRLTALADHDDETIRCTAYRVLLMDEPNSLYHEAFGAFVESGRPFLNAETIEEIATVRFGTRRLQALRQRLAAYREELSWPASAVVREQFGAVLDLLCDHARRHPDQYHPVRCELASWALHGEDPDLAEAAQRRLAELVVHYEEHLQRTAVRSGTLRLDQVEFDDDVSDEHRRRQWELLSKTPFLVQSIRLAFAEPNFDVDRIPARGLWVSSLATTPGTGRYRWSLRTRDGHHYALLVVIRDDLDAVRVLQTNYWMLAIGSHPFGTRRLPRFGCSRPELGAMSLEFVGELNVAERLRGAVATLRGGGEAPDPSWWRRLLVGAMATFLEVWRNSGRRVAPGAMRPENVAVPEPDYLDSSRVLSLTGWFPYQHPSDLFALLHRGFFARVAAHHPECTEFLEPRWVAEACVESLGPQEAVTLLAQFLAEEDPEHPWPAELTSAIREYLEEDAARKHVPLKVEKAVNRYHRWARANPGATLEAACDQVESVARLYHVEPLGEVWRYHLFRHTIFADAPQPVRQSFDALIHALRDDPEVPATRRVELSELQAAVGDDERRSALARAVFPRSSGAAELDVLAFGEPGHERVTVRTKVIDRFGESYDVREPIGPEEVGHVYRLFYREHFPRTASESDRFLVAFDRDERVVAALIHRHDRPGVVHLDGIVVRASLWGRGLATVLLEDLCRRLVGQGVEVVRTNFFLRRFCERRGFRLDRRWGGLVRFLGESGVSSPD